MIEPKRVLRALAEHWALIEPLCERFDQGTLSLVELRQHVGRQQLESTPQDITQLLDVWIRLDILVPVAKSPNRFELNAQIHDFLAYLRREHRLGLCLEIEAYLRHLERLAGHIQDAFDNRDSDDLARQLRLLDMRVRDVLKKLDNDEQALVAVAERAKTSNRQIPLRQRYAEVLATWDEYVEPMIQLVNADGAFEQGVRKVETVLLKLLGEQARLGHLVDDDMLLRTHARILEMQTSAQLTLRHARELLLPLREEARRHNAVTRGAALALSVIRRKGIDAVPQAAMPMFTRPQSTFLGSASQVEAYVYALARFEPKPARFPKAHNPQSGALPRAPRTVKEMAERCEQALPLPDLMVWLLEQEPEGATDELLYWFSRLSREKRFKRERLDRREYTTQEHLVSLRSFALTSSREDATSAPTESNASPAHAS
ncbi:Mks condensin complex protein MksB [Pseudomonas sp. NPDC090592]|uniref:Mks condensin complex protein MksB n=1 Tax=Pseudomonas sp. NPDC090592 TaxID=3364480 RepID=UPI00383B3D53